MRRRLCRLRQRAGFSMLEALIAVGVIGLAGSAILLATEAASQTSQDALERLIAGGLANQLVDEIMGLPYKEQGQLAESWPIGPEVGEIALPQSRRLFDDSDDFNNYVAQPVDDAWAIELGQGDGQGGLRPANFRLATDYFDKWAVLITVSYLDETDPTVYLPIPGTSKVRAVEVFVYRVDGGIRREVTKVRRVTSYVPQLGP